MSRNFLQSSEFREQVAKDLERERMPDTRVQIHQPENEAYWSRDAVFRRHLAAQRAELRRRCIDGVYQS